MDAQERSGSDVWDVPYLPLDPKDVGRDYEAIIRVNSQSGKGGVAYLMNTEHHLDLPRGLQIDFAQKVQAITDARGGELTADELMEAFTEHYLGVTEPFVLVSYSHESGEDGDRLVARMRSGGEGIVVIGRGQRARSPRSSTGSSSGFGIEIDVRDYHEHAMSKGEDATAAAYVEADVDDEAFWGVGIHPSIVTASLRAVVNAVNRAHAALASGGRGDRAGVRRRSTAESSDVARALPDCRSAHSTTGLGRTALPSLARRPPFAGEPPGTASFATTRRKSHGHYVVDRDSSRRGASWSRRSWRGAYAQSRRRAALRDQFGPEYDRTVGSAGSRRQAERELAEREKASRVARHPAALGGRTRPVHGRLAAGRAALRRRPRARRTRGGQDRARRAGRAAATRTTTSTRRRRPSRSTIRTSSRGTATATRWCTATARTGEERTENLRKAMVDFRAVFEQLVEPQAEPAER